MKRPWFSSPRGPVTNQRPVARMRLCLGQRSGLHPEFPEINATVSLHYSLSPCVSDRSHFKKAVLEKFNAMVFTLCKL